MDNCTLCYTLLDDLVSPLLGELKPSMIYILSSVQLHRKLFYALFQISWLGYYVIHGLPHPSFSCPPVCTSEL